MPEIPGYVLIHLARVVRTDRAGARDEQGERQAVPVDGPWFPARRMSQRPSESDAEPGGRRREEVRWQLLYGAEYDDGSPLIDPPGASDEVEVDLGDGVPLRYTVTNPRALDTGPEVIGGEVDLVEAGDSA